MRPKSPQRGKRIALPTGLVKSQRQQPPRFLPQRVLGSQPIQVRDNLCPAAEAQRCFRQPLRRGQPHFLQSSSLQVRPFHAGELLKGSSAPGRKRWRQQRLHGCGII